MERATLLSKIYWNLQANWHLHRRPMPDEPSIKEAVKALQTLLLDTQDAMLERTLCQVFAQPSVLPVLSRLDIALYQEGAEQRVWRAQATLADGTSRAFGIIVARAPGASSVLTQHDFGNLQALHARQERYCVMPYVCGMLPVAAGLAAYTVEWLDEHKELVFEIAYGAGVFVVNAHGAHRRFSPQASRQIWRRIGEILWWYPGLRRVNIQAGDFVGRVGDDGQVELKLTTARELVPEATPVERIHTLLRSVITASGYLSNGRQPFDRHMSQAVFLHRMQAVLQRRFGDQAVPLACQQWELFQQGAFAQQEDWLKEDCVLATYDCLRAGYPTPLAWYETHRRWTAYTNAVQAGHLPPSWWFPAADIPVVLDRLAQQQDR
jgi:hypothetical protein